MGKLDVIDPIMGLSRRLGINEEDLPKIVERAENGEPGTILSIGMDERGNLLVQVQERRDTSQPIDSLEIAKAYGYPKKIQCNRTIYEIIYREAKYQDIPKDPY